MEKIMKTNVLIIGGGIIGISIADRLLHEGIKDILIVEKNRITMKETSSHNSGLIHGGFDATPGSLKARFNVEGRHMMEERFFDKNIKGFEHAPIKSFILAYNEQDIKELDVLYEQGIKNGLDPKEMEIISGDKVREIDQYISKDVLKAFVCNSSTIIDPYEFGILLQTNAIKKGLKIVTNFEVNKIKKSGSKMLISSKNNIQIEANFIFNASGAWAEEVARLIEETPEFRIQPKRGQYIILDKKQGEKVGFNVYFLTPSKHGKGVIVAPQFDGRVLVGPSAEDGVPLADTQLVTPSGIEFVKTIGKKINPYIDMERIETVMAGSRPMNLTTNDYHIKMSNNKNFKMLHVAGTQSPALSGSLAIAKYAFKMYKKNN